MPRDATPTGSFLDYLQNYPLPLLEEELERLRADIAEKNNAAQLLELAISSRRRQNGDRARGADDAATTRPTLKKAILAVMADGGFMREWGPASLHEALKDRQWAPTAKSARNQIQSRLADLVESGQIERLGEGRYVLATELRGAPGKGPGEA